MTFPEVGYVTGSDEHDTPAEIFGPISDAVDGFDLDPCASATSQLADRNVTKGEDGLSIEWYGKVWLNPPYSEVGEWLKYAVNAFEHGQTDLIVALCFARTGTQWFHRYAAEARFICFLEGRLSFGEAENSAPAPSMIAVFGEEIPKALKDVLARRGMVFEKPPRRW